MNTTTKRQNEFGLSCAESARRRFTKSKLNTACLIFVVLLILTAAFAPFLANDLPFIIRIGGQLHLPLFKNLQPVDYCVLLAVLVGLIQLCTARRWLNTLRQFGISCGIILLGSVLIMLFVPKRIDTNDYRAMIAKGTASNAVFAPIPYGYNHTDLASRMQGPSRKHSLGTDDVGCDVLSRLIYGSRISLSVGFVAVGISIFIGVLVGAVMGYFGGIIDFIGMRIVEVVMAVPVFFLIITILAFFPRSTLNIIVVIGITSWTGTARLVRAEFLKLRGQNYIQAAISLGLPLHSILFKHMLINAISPVIINATFGMSSVIFTEATLSFLGFGASPSTPSWGQILSLGVGTTGGFYWWLSLFPGMAIFLTVLAYNLIGEGLQSAISEPG